ncbi:glycosyltransferase [Sphingosinicella sp.]|uniref:glycosyltransferase n=1 Tax=Sphingosinicella sp. TaxID=1917971 RepID=UPI004037EA6F
MTGRRISTRGYEGDRPAPLTISLVIPAHNEEAYIGACLDAVMQHVAERVCEIIVVDNDSNDGTAEIVRRYERVTYVFEPSKGITKARQRGYQSARGDILAFADADTIPPAGWIERIDEQFHQDAGLACISGPYRYYDLPRLQQSIASAWFVAARPLYRVFGYLVVGGNFAIRRSALDAMGGFDATIEFYGEDADIARRARKFGRVLFTPRLVMPTSGRRLKREGYVKMAGIYLVNFLSIAFRGKPATRGYTDVR